jgi:hypothetical protein
VGFWGGNKEINRCRRELRMPRDDVRSLVGRCRRLRGRQLDGEVHGSDVKAMSRQTSFGGPGGAARRLR